MKTMLGKMALLVLSLSLAAAGGVGCAGGAADGDDGADGNATTTSTTTTASAAETPANAPGKHLHRIPVDGVARSFIVYVPEKARGVSEPVVFMFHGTSGTGEKFYEISGWREKADETGLIAVFPTALTYCLKEDENRDGDFDDRGETKITTKWAAGKLGDPLRMPLCSEAELALLSPERRALVDHPLMDDVAFVRAMLAFLGARYLVDPKRVYMNGFSNGASFTSRLVLDLSDRIAAAGIGAGGLDLPAQPVRPMSVVQWVGSRDAKVLARLGLTELPMSESLLTEVPEIFTHTIAPMLTMLRLGDDHVYRELLLSGRKASAFIYANSLRDAPNRYRFLVFEGLGHQYPNGVNYPVKAADLLWKFFAGQRLP